MLERTNMILNIHFMPHNHCAVSWFRRDVVGQAAGCSVTAAVPSRSDKETEVGRG